MTKLTADTASERSGTNPYLVLILAILGISFGSLFAKLSDAPSLIIAVYRNLFAAVLLAPFALTSAREELISISKRDILLTLAGGIFLALHFATWLTSLKYTSVASSTVLVTMQPIFVVIGSYLFLKEGISLRSAASGLLALAGSILIGLSDFTIGGQALWGDFLALSGAIFIAVYVLIGRSLRQRFSLIAYTFIVYGTCSIVLVIMAAALKIPML
ncbi:MAG: DMT family transporter, partial [Clostridia bacterium]|nr:DMT family transporter [Clostridia bacterium]